MSSKPISQAQARKYKARVEQLEDLLDNQAGAWVREWPGGVHIASQAGCGVATIAAVNTSRKLGHAVVAVPSNGELHLFALALPKLERMT